MKQLGFAFDQGRCIGCRTCQMACKDYKDTEIGTNFRRVYEYEGGDWKKDSNGVVRAEIFAAYASISCNHCDNPACIRVCPVGAITKFEDTGIVEIDTEKCTGCDACAMACPYEAPQKIASSGKYDKCNLCRERLEADMQPICVQSCPTRALHFGEIATLRQEFGDKADVAPLVNPNMTKPNLTVIPCKETRQFDDSSVRVTAPNPKLGVIAVVQPSIEE